MSAPVPELVRDFIARGRDDEFIANALGHPVAQVRKWRDRIAGTTGARAAMLPAARLVPHPKNVRASLGDLTELVASIRAVGLVQPLVVTRHPRRRARAQDGTPPTSTGQVSA
ncbi:MAG: ParB-like nuclease domain-containing protein [Frankiales bacterium]|nr:ParB-like nuclease domain-containing protein [Frankiales bacterium]